MHTSNNSPTYFNQCALTSSCPLHISRLLLIIPLRLPGVYFKPSSQNNKRTLRYRLFLLITFYPLHDCLNILQPAQRQYTAVEL